MITATAALEDKLITPDEIVNDTGKLKVDVLTFKTPTTRSTVRST